MLVVYKQKQQTVEEYLDYVRRHETQKSRDDYGIPTLCSAIDKFRSVYLIKELLQDGADVNAISCLKRSPLPSQRALDTMRYKRWGNFAPIHVAVSLGLYDIVKLLFDNGADLNFQTTKGFGPVDFLFNDNVTRCLEKGSTSYKADDYEILKLMHRAGVDLSTKEKRQQSTLLHRATVLKNQTIVNYLINHSCEVNCADDHGRTPLQHCEVDAVECARILLQNGANPNSQDNSGSTIYHRSIEYYSSNCCIDYLRLLYDFHADPNVRNKDGETPLHIYFKKLIQKMGIEELIMILNKLLTYGADPNIVDELERTPIYYLISYSYTKTMDAWNIVWSLLITSLRHGAILNKGDIIGIPLLHELVESCLLCTAECFDSKSFMEILHPNYNVEVNCQDLYGRSVLHLVSAKGNWTMAEILINHGADIEIEDCDGNTPLHVAILCKQWAFAKKMLLLPLRKNFVIECTARNDQASLGENHSAFEEFREIGRSNSIPTVKFHLENKNCRQLDCCNCEIRNEKLRKNCNTRPTSKQCKESDKIFVTREKHHVEWTNKKLEIIANYVERQNLLSWGRVETKMHFSESIICPALSIGRDLVSRINKSSLLELCEENCVGEFHLKEECEEEHCNIAKQVFRLMTDLVKKCSEIDPRLESKLLWTGSSAEGTKMWLPDEFDFSMELVRLQGSFKFDNPFWSPHKLVLKRECHELWSNLCLHEDPHILSIVKLKEYISTLLWKAAFLLEKKKYGNIRFRLCQYDNAHQFIKPTKVGVNVTVSWHGKKYKKLVIGIDLTPAILVTLTAKQLSQIHRHSVERLVGNQIHVIPYFKYGDRERWRPSFSLVEVHIMKTLSRKQIGLYKALKFFRDIHKSVFAEIPSYHLKTFLLNYFFHDNDTGFPACFAEYDNFHTSLRHTIHHLNAVAFENFDAKIGHFFINYDLFLLDYDMRWVKSTQNIIENC